MAVRLRLTRRGRRNAPYYRLVVADSRSPRDGRIIDSLGLYHPIAKDEENQLRHDSDDRLGSTASTVLTGQRLAAMMPPHAGR